MSVIAIAAFGGFAALTVWGFTIALKGMTSEAPPYMQGVGKTVRHDLRKAA